MSNKVKWVVNVIKKWNLTPPTIGSGECFIVSWQLSENTFDETFCSKYCFVFATKSMKNELLHSHYHRFYPPRHNLLFFKVYVSMVLLWEVNPTKEPTIDQFSCHLLCSYWIHTFFVIADGPSNFHCGNVMIIQVFCCSFCSEERISAFVKLFGSRKEVWLKSFL